MLLGPWQARNIMAERYYRGSLPTSWQPGGREESMPVLVGNLLLLF
jgi:hypothetical protein